jgi:hypothetical protein
MKKSLKYPQLKCSQCTYLNWPKSKHCIQCNSIRSPSQSLRTSPIPTNQTPKESPVNSPLTIKKQPQTTTETVIKKWSCKHCTYQNWPKSNNIFHVGLTLIHLCYQYKHKDELMKLLNRNSKVKNQLLKKHYQQQQQQQQQRYPSPTTIYKIKFSPCQSCPLLATNIIERYITSNIRQRKFDITANVLQQSTATATVFDETFNNCLCY